MKQVIDFTQQSSLPARIVLIFTLISVINILLYTTSVDIKIAMIAKKLFYGIIYVFILNWLCSNNLCWASWLIVMTQILYVFVTLVFVINLLKMASVLSREREYDYY